MQEYLDYYMSMGIPRQMLIHDWGGTVPDELIYQGIYAKMGTVPSIRPGMKRRPIFFGHKKSKDSPVEVTDKYHILSIYGNGDGNRLTQIRYLKLYDTLLRKITRADYFPFDQVMRDKHANIANSRK